MEADAQDGGPHMGRHPKCLGGHELSTGKGVGTPTRRTNCQSEPTLATHYPSPRALFPFLIIARVHETVKTKKLQQFNPYSRKNGWSILCHARIKASVTVMKVSWILIKDPVPSAQTLNRAGVVGVIVRLGPGLVEHVANLEGCTKAGNHFDALANEGFFRSSAC